MPIAVPNTPTAPEQTSGMETLQVADLDVYRDPASSEEAKLAECKKVRSGSLGPVWYGMMAD